jgi:hypothetical protein
VCVCGGGGGKTHTGLAVCMILAWYSIYAIIHAVTKHFLGP